MSPRSMEPTTLLFFFQIKILIGLSCGRETFVENFPPSVGVRLCL